MKRHQGLLIFTLTFVFMVIYSKYIHQHEAISNAIPVVCTAGLSAIYATVAMRRSQARRARVAAALESLAMLGLTLFMIERFWPNAFARVIVTLGSIGILGVVVYAVTEYFARVRR